MMLVRENLEFSIFQTTSKVFKKFKLVVSAFNDIRCVTVAKCTNRITDQENFEFLVVFGAKISHFAIQSVQIQGKLMQQIYFTTVSKYAPFSF